MLTLNMLQIPGLRPSIVKLGLAQPLPGFGETLPHPTLMDEQVKFGILGILANPGEQRSCQLCHFSRFVERKPPGGRKLVVLTHKPRESNPGNLSLCYHGTRAARHPFLS